MNKSLRKFREWKKGHTTLFKKNWAVKFPILHSDGVAGMNLLFFLKNEVD